MLNEFIKSNFNKVIQIQDGFDHDEEMVKSVKAKSLTNEMVKNWMRNYGLFQGIISEDRIRIAEVFINFSYQLGGDDQEFDLRTNFQDLHSKLYKICKKKMVVCNF